MLVLSLLLSGCAALQGARPFDDADLARVRPGMSREETLQLFGAPAETMSFARTGTQSWDYLGQDSWGYMTQYSVIFGPQGTVVGTVTRRINDGGDHGK